LPFRPDTTSQLTAADFALLTGERLPELLFGLIAFWLGIGAFLLLRRLLLPAGSLPLWPPTLPSFFIGVYSLFIGIPSAIWYALSVDQSRHTTLLAVNLTPTLFMIGIFLATNCSADPAGRIQRFLASPLTSSGLDHYLMWLYVPLLLGGVLVALAMVFTSEQVPLFVSLTSYGEVQGEDVRQSVYTAPQAVQFAYALGNRFLFPLAILSSYFLGSVYGGIWLLLFPATFVIALGASLLTLERSGPFGMFVILIMAMYLRNRATLSKWHVAILAGALFVGGMVQRAQYQLTIRPDNILEYMFRFLSNRVYFDPSYMTYYAFQQYNETTQFLGGRSIRLLSIFGIQFESFSSVGFLGDTWVNFGWPGVVIACVALGFVMQAIQLGCFKRRDIPTMMLWVLLMVNAVWLMYGSILSIMVVTVYALSGVFALVLTMFPADEAQEPAAPQPAAAESWRSPSYPS
jgi:hypothetical protein